MFDLDSTKAIEHLDRQNILGRLKSFPDELVQVAHEAQKIKPLRSWRGITDITICSTGGSDLAGQIAARLAAPTSPIAIRTIQDFSLPGYINEHSLVICLSYSGDTPETIACAKQALSHKAHVFIVTTEGSPLDHFAELNNLPVFFITCPPPSRSALAHLAVPILGVFDRIGITSSTVDTIIPAATLLEKTRESIKDTRLTKENPAKILAKEIGAKTPIILTSEQFASVGIRFAQMINENAKAHAYTQTFSHYAHSMIEAHDKQSEFLYIIVRSQLDNFATNTAADAITSILDSNKSPYIIFDLVGQNTIEQMLFGIYVFDFVSFYLAMIRHENPFYTDHINTYITTLKQKLSD